LLVLEEVICMTVGIRARLAYRIKRE